MEGSSSRFFKRFVYPPKNKFRHVKDNIYNVRSNNTDFYYWMPNIGRMISIHAVRLHLQYSFYFVPELTFAYRYKPYKLEWKDRTRVLEDFNYLYYTSFLPLSIMEHVEPLEWREWSARGKVIDWEKGEIRKGTYERCWARICVKIL